MNSMNYEQMFELMHDYGGKLRDFAEANRVIPDYVLIRSDEEDLVIEVCDEKLKAELIMRFRESEDFDVQTAPNNNKDVQIFSKDPKTRHFKVLISAPAPVGIC